MCSVNAAYDPLKHWKCCLKSFPQKILSGQTNYPKHLTMNWAAHPFFVMEMESNWYPLKGKMMIIPTMLLYSQFKFTYTFPNRRINLSLVTTQILAWFKFDSSYQSLSVITKYENMNNYQDLQYAWTYNEYSHECSKVCKAWIKFL